MFKLNDYVIYKRDICKIKEIKKINNKDYYLLVPVDDDSLTINVPIDLESDIRGIITKEEADKIIDSIPSVDIIDCPYDKMYEYEYKSLLSDMEPESLVKIIKTTYLRNKERVDNKRKIGEKDDAYFKKAEKLLYTELSLALGMSFEETKDYVISKVEEKIKED